MRRRELVSEEVYCSEVMPCPLAYLAETEHFKFAKV